MESPNRSRDDGSLANEENTMPEALRIGTKLVELCNAGESEKAVDELYSNDIVSIEGQGSEEMPARMEGIDAIRKKGEWWFANHEVHGMKAAGPFCGHKEFLYLMGQVRAVVVKYRLAGGADGQ
jgi:hypothetical protein